MSESIDFRVCEFIFSSIISCCLSSDLVLILVLEKNSWSYSVQNSNVIDLIALQVLVISTYIMIYHDGLLCNGDSSRFRQLGRSTEPQTSCRNVSVKEAGLCRLRLKYVNHMPCLIFVGGVGFQMLGRNCHMQPFGHCMICHLHAMGSPSCSANSSYKILVTPACLASKEGREFHELIMESSTQNISKRTRKFPATFQWRIRNHWAFLWAIWICKIFSLENGTFRQYKPFFCTKVSRTC